MPPCHPPALEDLRRRIYQLERPTMRLASVLPFGLPCIDESLPEGGLLRGTLHEIAGGGVDEAPAATAALFAAGILARFSGPVLWCAVQPDIFPPGLACAGLHPDRLLHARVPHEKALLQTMEEALRHPRLAAVVGELCNLPMTASRRLMLAAEKSGVMALALRRGPAVGLMAAFTRWRITPVPSAFLPGSGIGRARWRVELTRCRGGVGGKNWTVEACDAQGYLCLSAALADRSATSAPRRAA